MLNDGTTLTARDAFERGFALVQQGRYEQALPELQSAEALFRQADARGHPFTTPLVNGISGLANTLLLSGRCHQQLDNPRKAAQCYETCFINAKFESRRHLKVFSGTVNRHLLACYQRIREFLPQDRVDRVRRMDPPIDTDCNFPYSLSDDAVVLFRLYELAPEQYEELREPYLRAKSRDTDVRRREKKSDETTMRKLSFMIWGVLIVIWAIYGLAVINTLITNK